MIDFGKSLREAREAKGLSIGQLAETTKILPAMIEDLEKCDFKRIAAPIFGRGFVKLYCEAVGLDAKPFIAEFMEIVHGNRETVIRERKPLGCPPPEPPVPEPEAPPVVPAFEQQQVLPEPTVPESADDAGSPFVQAVGQTTDVLSQQDLFSKPAASEEPSGTRQTISRYSSPFRLKSSPAALPPAFWRMSVLAVAGLLVLLLIFWGLRTLYRATTSADIAPVDAIAQTETSVHQSDETPQSEREPERAAPARREPQKVPALYID